MVHASSPSDVMQEEALTVRNHVPSVTIVFRKMIALFVLLLLMWGFLGAALLSSENISSLVVVPIWTLFLAIFVMLARVVDRRKLILEEDRIGWHNGWQRDVKWYPRAEVVAAYEIDQRRNIAVSRSLRAYKGYGIVLRDPEANKVLFWLVTHSTTLSKVALTRLRGLLRPAESAAILVICWPSLKDRHQIPILMDWIHGSRPRLIQ